jgi:hypothetical protein
MPGTPDEVKEKCGTLRKKSFGKYTICICIFDGKVVYIAQPGFQNLAAYSLNSF